MDIVTIQYEEPFDRAAAEAEIRQLERERTARQIAALADHAELDALHREGNRDAMHRLPTIGYVLITLALGACCGAGGVLAWAYWLGRQ